MVFIRMEFAYFEIIATVKMCVFVLLPLLLVPSITCWDLSSYNISENYFVSSIATYGVRAFLALPRSSCCNNATHPTVVEVGWHNEHTSLFRKQPYFFDEQNWNECDHIQDALYLEVETMKARLWILDKGNENCPAKITVYYLFQKVKYSYELPDSLKNDVSSLVVDSPVSESTRVYVGLKGMNRLLVFCLVDMKLWTLTLQVGNSPVQVRTEFLALSRRDSVVFMTGGEEREIFSVDAKQLRTLDEEIGLNVTFLGEKLGPSSSLVTDLKDGLSYYLTRDFAIVRWNTRNPSQAEYYTVLAQSYEILPFVSQLFTDPQNGIWALANLRSPTECISSNNNGTNLSKLERRLVKILKYNTFR